MNRRNSRNNRARQQQRGAFDSRVRSLQQRPPTRLGGAPSARSLDDLIMGRNCVEEVLQHCPERLREVFMAEVREQSSPGGGARKSSLRDELKDAGIPIREVRREDLDSMVQSQSHQGVVARIAPRAMLSFEELLAKVEQGEEARILALDGVLDPQNFGAILRAAECFGITAVVWSKNRAAPLGPVVSKVSVGASEIIPLCPVSNLHRALDALKRAGAWSIGAVVAPGATPLDGFDKPKKWVLVMGSEGEGIQRLIEENLDFRVYISMFGALSSLNVSQATAVMLHALSS